MIIAIECRKVCKVVYALMVINRVSGHFADESILVAKSGHRISALEAPTRQAFGGEIL